MHQRRSDIHLPTHNLPETKNTFLIIKYSNICIQQIHVEIQKQELFSCFMLEIDVTDTVGNY